MPKTPGTTTPDMDKPDRPLDRSGEHIPERLDPELPDSGTDRERPEPPPGGNR